MSTEDLAQDREAQDWEINNRPRQAPREYAPGEPGYGPEFCNGRAKRTPSGSDAEDLCGIEMPPLRRAMGRHLCVECQSLLERGRLQ